MFESVHWLAAGRMPERARFNDLTDAKTKLQAWKLQERSWTLDSGWSGEYFSGSGWVRRGAGNPLIFRTCLWSLWLPVSITIVFALGDFSFGIYDERPLELLPWAIGSWLPIMWLLGMPLTLAVQLLHRRSRIPALAVATICAPISVNAYFLSVPLPSFLNTLFGAVLAWVVVVTLFLGIPIRHVCQRAMGRKKMGGPEGSNESV